MLLLRCPSFRAVAAGLVAIGCALAPAHGLTPISLLDDKLGLELEDGFRPDKDRVVKPVIAAFKARKGGAWGVIARGKAGIDPAMLGDYIGQKAKEYSKSLSWLPRLTWLKKETVTLHGRTWADLRFIGQTAGAKGPRDGLLYTRILATSYHGQLLEILFTSNMDRSLETKEKIDRMMGSVRLSD